MPTMADAGENETVTGHATVVIDRPADEVWAAVSDVGRIGEWSPENAGARWIDGADGPVEVVVGDRDLECFDERLGLGHTGSDEGTMAGRQDRSIRLRIGGPAT